MNIERLDRTAAKDKGWIWEPEDTDTSIKRLVSAYDLPAEKIRAALERGETLSTGFADYRACKQ